MQRLDTLARRLGKGAKLPAHLQTGLVGEREALFELRRLGYTVVARRWATAKVRGDVDLIGWKGDTLCFVEVKTRTARDAYAAEVAVDREKRVQLRKLARVYLKSFDEPGRGEMATRFDVLSVYLTASEPEFEVLENAFGWVEGRAEESGNRWRGFGV
ncbi:YraN family protein [Granulicella sibirica]|uniref:YraN family protein n=1 Tax=Granulicella sibirica TaxID=2479048 RepID=UPI001F501C44|nr:YraN family protein [Granulicella sibirica]